MRGSTTAWVVAWLVGAAVGASAEEIDILGHAQTYFRFDTDTGARTNVRTITGLAEDEEVVAVASGPSGILFGLTESRLYMIDAFTGAAKPAGPRFRDFSAASSDQRPIEFAIHPVTGVARVGVDVSIDPATMKVTRIDPGSVEGPTLVYAAGDPNAASMPDVRATAYHPFGAVDPTLYGIDSANATLVRLGPAGDAGFSAADDVVTTIAPLSGLPEGSRVLSLKAMPSGSLLLLARDPDFIHESIYSVDLATGALTAGADIGIPSLLDVSDASASVVSPARTLEIASMKVVAGVGRDRKDHLKIVGRIGLPAHGWANQKLRVDVGGIVREFILDARGRASSGRDSFRIAEPRDGEWRYVLVLHGTDFDQALGIREIRPMGILRPVVDVFVGDFGFDLTVFRTQRQLAYTIKGRSVLAR